MSKIGKFAIILLGIFTAIELLSTIYVPNYDIFDIFSLPRGEGIIGAKFSDRLQIVLDALKNDFVQPIYNVIKTIANLIGKVASFIENILG